LPRSSRDTSAASLSFPALLDRYDGPIIFIRRLDRC
jgi:hypothetical protein